MGSVGLLFTFRLPSTLDGRVLVPKTIFVDNDQPILTLKHPAWGEVRELYINQENVTRLVSSVDAFYTVKALHIRRIIIITMAVSWLCSQFVIGQNSGTRPTTALFENHAAWNAVYESVRPKDDNELSAWKYDLSVQSVFDTALEDSDTLRSQRPIDRLLVQRAAWYAFDSLASELNYHDEANQSLRVRLARVIAASALSADEIKQLPNTYVAKAVDDDKQRNPALDLDLPADLLQQNGEWLQISHKNIHRIGLTHEMSRRGRSEFLLFVRFPSGRKQAEEYLKGLNGLLTSAEGYGAVQRRRALPQRSSALRHVSYR